MTSALPRANTVILIGQLKASAIAKESLALSIETADGVVNTVLVVSAPQEMLASPLPEGVTVQVTGFLLPAGSKQQVVVSRERGHEVRILGQVQTPKLHNAVEAAVSAPVPDTRQPAPAETATRAPQPAAPQGVPSRSLGLRGLAAGGRNTGSATTPQQTPQAAPAQPTTAASDNRPKGLSRLARTQTARPEANDEPTDFPGDSNVPPVSAYEESYQQQSARPSSSSSSPGPGRRSAPAFAPSDRDLDIPW